MEKLFIPDKINVGYQERQDTYTGKLAYVVYFDKKGVLRKEASWNSWRDSKIPPTEFTNEPTEGFVLNKRAGGYKSDWNYRQSYSRVYDPRGFEFEITIDNLLFILDNCNAYKGKGLEGKFVYAWNRDKLVLLPVDTDTYNNSVSFSNIQGKKLSAKELHPGGLYKTKDDINCVYLGRLDVYNRSIKKERHHVFYDVQSKKFFYPSSIPNIISEEISQDYSDYANVLDKFNKGPNGSCITSICTIPVNGRKYGNFYVQKDNTVYEYYVNELITKDRTKIPYYVITRQIKLIDGKLSVQRLSSRDNYYNYYNSTTLNYTIACRPEDCQDVEASIKKSYSFYAYRLSGTIVEFFNQIAYKDFSKANFGCTLQSGNSYVFSIQGEGDNSYVTNR